jgi:hypothetical protein
MPAQEAFFKQRIGAEFFKIIKTYDASLAREAFADMGPLALHHLAESLMIEQQYESNEIPSASVDDPDFLWEELCESAREDGQKCSFFVVSKASKLRRSFRHVSADWPPVADKI